MKFPLPNRLLICDREYRAVSPAARKILQPTPVTAMYREWGAGEMESWVLLVAKATRLIAAAWPFMPLVLQIV